MSDTVGSVAVEVVPDARGWSEKLRAQIKNATATVNVNADTGEADAQLDEVARTRTAKIKADTSQLSEGAKSLDDFVGKLGLLPALALTAGSALIPLAAAIAGVTAAIAAPLAIAGGGVGLFALFSSVAVKDTEKQLKNIDTLKKKLDGLTKGTATYAATQKQLKDAQAALSPAQNHFADSLERVQGAFTKILNGPAGQSVLNVIASGLDAVAKILPVLAPVLAPVAREFGHLIDQLARASQSKGFADFIHQFAGQTGHDIGVFAHVLGNLALGFSGLFLALDNKHLSGGVLDGLLHLSQNFRDLGQGAKGSKWLKDFIDYFHKVGPQVSDTMGALARALGHAVQALAPLGPPVLHIIQGIADAFNRIPIPVLTALAAAAGGLVAFQKVGGLKATSFALSKLTGGQGIAGGLIGGASVQKVYVVNLPPNSDLPGGNPIVKDAEEGSKFSGLALIPQIATLAFAAFATYYAVKHDAVPTWRRATQEQGFPLVPVGGVSPANNPGAGQHLPLAIDPAAHERALNILGQGPSSVTQTQRATAGLQASLGRASAAIDLVGPHAAHAFGIATHAVQVFQAQINAIHDKRFTVIAQTEAAVKSLERLQALTIRDKSFNVIQNNIERGVGPGGGRQHHAAGGLIRGSGSGTSDSIAAWLSNGEFVVNAAATSRHRALLEAINARRMADGGMVGADAHHHHNLNKPLFTGEGPAWYKRAYKHGYPYAKHGPSHWAWPYQTSLDSVHQANEFEHWVNSKRVPFNADAKIVDYDMRGYWKKTRGHGWHHGMHFPDTWKTPYDTTFSNESKYASRNNPFYWHGNKLVDRSTGQLIFAASGGLISGPGGPRDDRVPAWLSNGEYVVNAESTRRHRSLLEQLNRDGYRDGGLVSRTVGSGRVGATEHHTHVMLDGQQIAHVVTPIAYAAADTVYHANQQYAQDVSGR